MSIDTLLEAARYLEWQAQQQQITHEEERCREKAELHSREAESRRAAGCDLCGPANQIQPCHLGVITALA